MRVAEINRVTNETDVQLWLDLDGDGKESEIKTGIGFFDHMMTLFSRHSGIQMNLTCEGDTWVDDHHSVEDIGITLGQAMSEALGDRKGIRRYASMTLPMDEALILVAVDISGRGGFYGELPFKTEKIGSFDTELVVEFFQAFALNAGITLHIRELAGENSHHIAEGCFKGLAHVLREAVEIDTRFANDIPSTKGVLASPTGE